MKITYTPIGIIHSPFAEPEGMPIQPAGAKRIAGTVELFETFEAGTKDLDGFSHLILIYHFHLSKGYQLTTMPFLDTIPHGVFATRAPKRPNPIGISIVRLIRVDGRLLHIENVDIIDKTPLLDIKPYVRNFDAQTDVKSGWLEDLEKTKINRKSDDRFSRK